MASSGVKGGTIYPPGNAADLLWFSSALPATVYGNWLASDDTWGSFASARVFDLRPYRAISLTFGAAALTGGSTPTATPLIIAQDFPEDTLSNLFSLNQITPTNSVAAGGGSLVMNVGDANSVAIAGGTYNGNAPVFAPWRLVAARIGVSQTGTPTGITNGRMFIWGFR